jgi:hypothetical protein
LQRKLAMSVSCPRKLVTWSNGPEQNSAIVRVLAAWRSDVEDLIVKFEVPLVEFWGQSAWKLLSIIQEPLVVCALDTLTCTRDAGKADSNEVAVTLQDSPSAECNTLKATEAGSHWYES